MMLEVGKHSMDQKKCTVYAGLYLFGSLLSWKSWVCYLRAIAKTTYQVNGKYKTAKVLLLQGVEDAVLLP